MYPHLSDFLQNLRDSFEEVIYIDDDDRGEHLYLIEYYIRSALSYIGLKRIKPKKDNISKQIDTSGTSEDKSFSIRFLSHLMKTLFIYIVRQLRLIGKIRTLRFSYNKNVIIAIDHTATYFVAKYSKGYPIIFWSFDILAEDAPWRIKNGFLEKLITSDYALQADVLMIQDVNRKNILEKSVGKIYGNTIFLPVGLNDSEFCRVAAINRALKRNFDTVKIIQSGLLSEIRLTVELVTVFQHWPTFIELHLHGKLCGNAVNSKIGSVIKKPILSSELYDVNTLMQFIDRFDIGFVGYGEADINHIFIENASTQLVSFLRLGIPVIVSGSENINTFIEKHHAGIKVTSLNDIENSIIELTDNYAYYSRNARQLYDDRFNLKTIFESNIIPSIAAIL